MAASDNSGRGSKLAVRAFGAACDLDVDFVAPRPYVVSAVLARCATDEDTAWQWTVPQRTQALLAVARAGGIDAVTALARCPREGCAETLELTLELESFVTDDAPERCAFSDGSDAFELRVPTGADQRGWLESALPFSGRDRVRVASSTMAASLVASVNGKPVDYDFELPPTTLESVERELEACDPITALDVAASCPACGDAVDVEIDLEGLILDALARTQREMLDSVHRLASRYHWSERDVLALPQWRRAYYLAAIAGA